MVRTGPLGGSVGNPQSLNRYTYVLNNPESLTDPLGLFGDSPSEPLPYTFGDPGNGCWYVLLHGVLESFTCGPGEVAGKGDMGSAAGGAPPQTQTKTCTALARVLQANPATVGAPLGHGAFNNPPNPIAPQAGSAAMTPSEFGGLTTAQLKPSALGISGYFPGTGVSFQGVTDVNGAGQTPLGFSNIRQYLEFMNPGQIIIELIMGPDLGSNVPVVITQSADLPCPTAPPFVADPVTGPTVG